MICLISETIQYFKVFLIRSDERVIDTQVYNISRNMSPKEYVFKLSKEVAYLKRFP